MYGLGVFLGLVVLILMLIVDEMSDFFLVLKEGYLLVKVKNCIFLMMEGGLLYIDIFDLKLKLCELYFEEF